MQNMLIKVGVNAVALWVAALVVNGVRLGEDADKLSTRLLTIVLVAIIFGVVNAVVKPIATFFSFPAIILTLGLFTFIVNAFMLQITEWICSALNLDFTIDHFFWNAVMAALVITLVSMVLNFVLPDDDKK
ncbi:MAG TPA: phage holin family protein [Tetrasphaera sp.]|jgi:putative membrane protein|uniref:Phage holin family protein n=1 Tax=Nostocoides vanveenii TaxID=330835 RepID=A0ABN2K9W6_9MICO|nr:phage holin family protein [Tetrasphaera sp.]HNQ06572.1 phage holin family protein [Tetrasphaera sp.]